MTDHLKKLSTKRLIEIAANDPLCSITNRAESLDPQGVHILWITVGFMNDSDTCRTKVLFKVMDYDKPFESVMDISYSDFDALENVEQPMSERQWESGVGVPD